MFSADFSDVVTAHRSGLAHLKAFERRLTEVIVSLNPSATRYRCIFVFMSICSVYGAILWLGDNDTFKTTLVQSLLNHMFFTISSIIMLLLLMGGIHRKVVAPSMLFHGCSGQGICGNVHPVNLDSQFYIQAGLPVQDAINEFDEVRISNKEARFTKNLSPDKVRLSALKGEAELYNLVLDENVLTDLLELPSWIKLTKAVCNKVAMKIQWTKLKSTPINIVLDEVIVEMETCEVLRDLSPDVDRPGYSSGGAYGFSDKVVDGMTVNVNSVTVNFKSHAFHASAHLSKIKLESRTPSWKKAHLQMTRVKDPDRGEVLIFKELDWCLLRIEAQAVKNGVIDEEVTPIRFITSQARCRITIKKKLIDCSVISSRLVWIMDDLLWVLTDSQLHQAFSFINSISSLVKQATELSQKVKGARKLESSHEYTAQANQMTRKLPPSQLSTKAKVFSHYDVIETSYHLYSSLINLHFIDETNPKDGERKHWLRYNENSTQRNAWVNQLMNTFHQRLIDLVASSPCQSRVHTPLHRAAPHTKDDSQSSTSQPKQQNPDSNAKSNGFNNLCNQWKSSVQNNLKKLMSSSFVFRVEDLTVYKVVTGNNNKQPLEVFLSRSDFVLPQNVSLIHIEHTMYYNPGGINFPVPAPNLYVSISPLLLIVDVASILWLNAFGLGLQQAKIFQNDSSEENRSYIDIRVEALMPKDKKMWPFSSPDINPMVSWLNPTDVSLLMKDPVLVSWSTFDGEILFEGDSLPENQPDRPASLNLQASRVIATNCRDSKFSSRASLSKCFDNFGFGSLFYESTEFPAMESDYLPIPELFIKHALGEDSHALSLLDQCNSTEVMNPTESTIKYLHKKLSRDMLWTENRSMWSLFLDPFWAEFVTIGGSKKKPAPFVDAFPLTLWIYSQHPEDQRTDIKPDARSHRPNHKLLKEYYKDKVSHGASVESSSSSGHKYDDTSATGEPHLMADMYSVAHITSLVNIQINHYQFLFLMRMTDKLTQLTEYLIQDTLAIVGELSELKSSLCLSAFIPQVQISLLLAIEDPQQNKNSSSICHDSSVDLSIGNECINNCVSHKPNSSDTQEFDHSGSGQLLNNPPINGVQQNEITSSSCGKSSALDASAGSTVQNSFSDVVVNVDSSFLPPSSRKQAPSDETRSLQSFTDDMDAASMKSDISSDSEQYVLVDYEIHPIEDALLNRSNVSTPKGENQFDYANEIREEGEVSSNEDDKKSSGSKSSEKRNDLVMFQDFALYLYAQHEILDYSQLKKSLMFQVVTIVIEQMQFIQQSHGSDSVVKASCNHVSLKQEELPQTWHHFQDVFSAKGRSWKESEKKEHIITSSTPIFKLRLDSGPEAAQRFNEEAISKVGHLSLLSCNIDINLRVLRREARIKFHYASEPSYKKKMALIAEVDGKLALFEAMSVITGILDLIEDEIILQPPVTPFKVKASNIKICLDEDRPMVNLTSPGPVPIDLNVHEIQISRNYDGVFHIVPVEVAKEKIFSSQSSRTVIDDNLEFSAKGLHNRTSTSSLETIHSSLGEELSTHRGDQQLLEQLQEQNEQLTVKLFSFTAMEDENRTLREQLNCLKLTVTQAQPNALENARVMMKLLEAQDEVKRLEVEKKSLVATMQLLQQNLDSYEKKSRGSS
ncbi:UHRF1-binding protein 1-like [Nymphon striatum]|nr:UHRF1-binding protein 1-like [Nymphon striatum]